MAHSCRWRFPARPGGSSNSGTGRRAGRIRVTASLRSVPRAQPGAAAALGPGFDAALQVSSAIGSNLRKFRDVLGESSDSSSGEVSNRGEPDGERVGRGGTGTVRETQLQGVYSERQGGGDDELTDSPRSDVEDPAPLIQR